MNLTTFKYVGPISSVSLTLPNGQNMDVLLNPKRPVKAPADHEYIKTLIAQNRLIPIETQIAQIAVTDEANTPTKKGTK